MNSFRQQKMASINLTIQILLSCVICVFGQPFPNQVVDATIAQTVLQRIKPILDGTSRKQEKTLTSVQQAMNTRMQKMEAMVHRELFLTDFGMLLDHDTLYNTRYMSFDCKTLFNRPYPPRSSDKQISNELLFTYNWPAGRNQLQNYRGVLGTKPVSKANKVCFEINLSYFAETALDHLDLVSEIALAKHDALDSGIYIGKHDSAWSLQFYSNDTSIVKACEAAGETTNIQSFGPSDGGTFNKIEIGILVDTPKQTITFVDRQTNSIMCRYSNVDTSEDLWPTFAVYSAQRSEVNLTLERNYYHPDNTWIYV